MFDWQISELCTSPAFTFKVKPGAHRNSWPAAMMLGSTGELDTADHFRLSVDDWRGIFFSYFFVFVRSRRSRPGRTCETHFDPHLV